MKKKLTKRGKLYLANGIVFAVLLVFLVSITLMNHQGLQVINVFIIALAQCAFTLMSLIVYYLSIISDSVSKMAENAKEKETEREKE